MSEEKTGGSKWFNQAYAVAGGGSQNLQASKGMTKIGNIIAKPIAKELQDRRNKFKEFAEFELTRKPGLTDEEYDKKIDELNEMRADYMWADNASRMKIMRHMADMKLEQDTIDAEKQELANSIEDEKNGIGGNKEFMESEEGQLMLEAYKGGLVDTDGDGKPDSYVDSKGNNYSQEDMKKIIETQSKDGTSQDIIREMALQIRNVSSEQIDLSDPNAQFNWDNTYAQINNVIENGNFRSLVNDNMIQGRSSTFRSDFENALMNQTYTWFGIEADSYKDPNLDGDNDYTTISAEDAKVIADEFLKMDEDGNPENPEAKEWVTKYFTAHMEKQHKSGQSKIYAKVDDIKSILNSENWIDNAAGDFDSLNTPDGNIDVAKVEARQSELASVYGQLNKEEQEKVDFILNALDKLLEGKPNEIPTWENNNNNQNKYNTNAQ